MNRIPVIPEEDSSWVKKTISIHGIIGKPFYVDISPEPYSANGYCANNVSEKVRREGGSIIVGWQFCEHSYMIEGEFHAIWQSPSGKYVDITPSSIPDVKKILFVIDNTKSFGEKQIDNIRLNTTNSPIVDDMIELCRTRYRFLNSADRMNIVDEYELTPRDHITLKVLGWFENELETFYYSDGSIVTDCFCNSGLFYENCHRYLFALLRSEY